MQVSPQTTSLNRPATISVEPLVRHSSRRVRICGAMRRHAVPVRLPEGSEVAQKPILILYRQLLPEVVGDRSKRIHHDAPAQVLVAGRGDPVVQFAEDGAEAAGIVKNGRGSRRQPQVVNVGQNPAAREHVSAAAQFLAVQGQDAVHGSQAGPDNENAFVLGADPQRVAEPRRKVPALATIAGPGYGCRGGVADREYHAAGADGGAVAQRQAGADGIGFDPDGFGLDPPELVCIADFGLEQRLDISPVEFARREGFGCSFGPRSSAKPVEEVSRFGGPGAHFPGGDIEQVLIEGGRVGEAGSQARAWLDDGDPAGESPAQQLRRYQGTATTSADNRNIPLRGVR
jgi:hypothetical protein